MTNISRAAIAATVLGAFLGAPARALAQPADPPPAAPPEPPPADPAAPPADPAPPAAAPVDPAPPAAAPPADPGAPPSAAAPPAEPEVVRGGVQVPPATPFGRSAREVGAVPPAARTSLIQEDVEPTVPIVMTRDIQVAIGGLVQIHLAPYVGDDSLVSNGDPASSEGFRLRRARLGFDARFARDFGLFLSLTPLTPSAGQGVVSDAKITYAPLPELAFSVGSGKVPYSRAALQSSRRLAALERPLVVGSLTPSRRLGGTVESQLFGRRLNLLAGVLNATEGFAAGNVFGGLFYGGRAELSPFGGTPDPVGRVDGVSLGGGGFLEDGAAVRTLAYSVDVLAAFQGVHGQVEWLCDEKTPTLAAPLSPTLPDSITRCGGYVELGYAFRFLAIQPVLRGEYFDDNRAVENAGDAAVFDGGINAQLVPKYLRGQLHYIARRELRGEARDNDSVVLSFLGTF